jgi:hypothetical protein
MELKDTVALMNSADYKDRFKAEYCQTAIRHKKLNTICVKHDAGTLDFSPVCPIELLKEQLAHMEYYLYVLEVRAEIAGIDLSEFDV